MKYAVRHNCHVFVGVEDVLRPQGMNMMKRTRTAQNESSEAFYVVYENVRVH